MSKELLANATENVTGDAVAFTAPTTLVPEGVFDGAVVEIQLRVPTKGWRPILTFGRGLIDPENVEGNGSYELRSIVTNAGPTTSISINATE